MSSHDKSYNLKLAAGQNWQFVALPDAAGWLDSFASIMKLETGASVRSPRLIFSRNIKKSGWKRRDLGSIEIYSHNKSPDYYCSLGEKENHELDIVRMWLSLSPIHERAVECGGLPFHSALVERNGRGVLLAARGDTGKSTCCRRIPLPWRGVCDDEVLIVRSESGGYRVHPFPTWSNYLYDRDEDNWSAEQNLPLSAVFFLEQSGEDTAEPIGKGRAAMMINDSASQVCRRMLRRMGAGEEASLRKKIFENACLLSARVPSFTLRFTLNGRFWEEMDKACEDAA